MRNSKTHNHNRRALRSFEATECIRNAYGSMRRCNERVHRCSESATLDTRGSRGARTGTCALAKTKTPGWPRSFRKSKKHIQKPHARGQNVVGFECHPKYAWSTWRGRFRVRPRVSRLDWNVVQCGGGFEVRAWVDDR